MKFIHMADLHIGKRVNGFSMIEDQTYILDQILGIVRKEEPDGILIAGDVYDKSQPSVEAVELLDDFLTELTEMGRPVFLISGNHDSPERLGFGSRLLREEGLHIAGAYQGAVVRETLHCGDGAVDVYLLPFLKPAFLRPFVDEPVESCQEAVRIALEGISPDSRRRNVLVAHQFVTWNGGEPERSDSETLSLGGAEQVDALLFAPFDYVALGHLHGAQRIGRDSIRYAGSPLKYSYSEIRQKKSITLIEMGGFGEPEVRMFPLKPIRELREVKGPLKELIRAGQELEREKGEPSQDYIHAVLTDSGEVYDAVGQLRLVYPNLMGLDFERVKICAVLDGTESIRSVGRKSPMDLFQEFYRLQQECEPGAAELERMKRVFEEEGGLR